MNVLSSFSLKMMAIIFMAMDHMYTYLPKTMNIPIWFGYLGKLAAPIFFYLVVEGFFHTKSRKQYTSRVFLMGLIMIGVDIVFGIYNNIFLSIGCGLLMLTGIDKAKNASENSSDKVQGITLAVLFAILGGIFTEASIYGVVMILIFYFFREKKNTMAILYVAFSLLFLITMIGPHFVEAAMMWDYQWMMVFAIIPIWMYNGELGFSNKFVKWAFYWFYPVHLIIIKLISNNI
ncbi:MAG: TraX family protein [Cellulosilyticaceae bacterium]